MDSTFSFFISKDLCGCKRAIGPWTILRTLLLSFLFLNPSFSPSPSSSFSLSFSFSCFFSRTLSRVNQSKRSRISNKERRVWACSAFFDLSWRQRPFKISERPVDDDCTTSPMIPWIAVWLKRERKGEREKEREKRRIGERIGKGKREKKRKEKERERKRKRKRKRIEKKRKGLFKTKKGVLF